MVQKWDIRAIKKIKWKNLENNRRKSWIMSWYSRFGDVDLLLEQVERLDFQTIYYGKMLMQRCFYSNLLAWF